MTLIKKHVTLLMIFCALLNLPIKATRPWAIRDKSPEELEQMERKRLQQDAERRIRLHDTLRCLTTPEPNLAEQTALVQATQIGRMIDQIENPGTLLMQHEDWIPLPPVLLSLIEDYSQAEPTFQRLSELTNFQTWTIFGRRNKVHVALCRSRAAAYLKASIQQSWDSPMGGEPIFSPLQTDLCRWSGTFKHPQVVRVTLATTFDVLKEQIAQIYKKPKENLELCIQINDDLIIPCNGLECFLQPPQDFEHIIRVYDNTIEYDLEP